LKALENNINCKMQNTSTNDNNVKKFYSDIEALDTKLLCIQTMCKHKINSDCYQNSISKCKCNFISLMKNKFDQQETAVYSLRVECLM
jgi:hypothetical protein